MLYFTTLAGWTGTQIIDLAAAWLLQMTMLFFVQQKSLLGKPSVGSGLTRPRLCGKVLMVDHGCWMCQEAQQQ
jgi:hypothetical protein